MKTKLKKRKYYCEKCEEVREIRTDGIVYIENTWCRKCKAFRRVEIRKESK